LKAETTHYIPLHENLFALGADIDIDARRVSSEIGVCGEMGLLVLGFYSMVGDTAIYKFTVNADTHS